MYVESLRAGATCIGLVCFFFFLFTNKEKERVHVMLLNKEKPTPTLWSTAAAQYEAG